jgi:coenzyme F420-0:L-glutamate ligase/coenzyme F420-1:gamma-L-glutamate ligase
VSAISLRPVEGLPEIAPRAPLGELIAAAARPADGEIVCISQKIVSKAEGRLRDLDLISPSPRAQRLASELGKDARLVELILSESARIVRAERGVLITETHTGLVCANAGIDASNVPGSRTVALLPEDADRSAREIRTALTAICGARVAVLIGDSFGRPWRIGQSEVAIGCAGIEPMADLRGRPDAHGHQLRSTLIATADQLVAAADLARDKLSRTPVVMIGGLADLVGEADGPGAAALVRPADEDLFR